jgi:hypothetical protein
MNCTNEQCEKTELHFILYDTRRWHEAQPAQLFADTVLQLPDALQNGEAQGRISGAAVIIITW